MFTPRSIIPMVLIGGLVVIEVLSSNPASSQHRLSQTDSDLILSILRGDAKPDTTEQLPASLFPFVEFDMPDSPGSISSDTRGSYSTVVGIATDSYITGSFDSSDVLSEVLPPLGTALHYAYQDNGIAWYSEGDNVLVIYPNETIQSFDSFSGESTNWLQDKLARLPINETDAYQIYQTTHKARIVAQTKTWVLMKFPSGGFLKVAKPTATSPVGGSFFGLPDILTGYNN